MFEQATRMKTLNISEREYGKGCIKRSSALYSSGLVWIYVFSLVLYDVQLVFTLLRCMNIKNNFL